MKKIFLTPCLMGLLLAGLLLAACTPAIQPAATATAAPNTTPTIRPRTATPTAVVVPFVPPTCPDGTPAVLVGPTLQDVRASQIIPGGVVNVFAAGGYVACGQVYNTSSTNFQLLLDDKPVDGLLLCYANRCESNTYLPLDIAPGTHEFKVTGGSKISFVVEKP